MSREGILEEGSVEQPSLLLIHDDSDVLDGLTRLFEARGFRVAIAATGFAAVSRLDAGGFDAVVAAWDAGRGVAAFAYQWVLRHRYGMRDRFVFLAAEPPDDFDGVVQGRCLLLSPRDLDELVRVTETIATRPELPDDRQAEAGAEHEGPSLLLIEDEPLQLSIMQELLTEQGFAVTAAECGREAIVALQAADYDVILSDWYMPNGSGGDLYEWLEENRPHLLERCVFMSASNPVFELENRAPGRPLVPKGQDSPALIRQLTTIAKKPRERAES